MLDDKHRALFQCRADTGRWEIPAGACEPGSDFRRTASSELLEESGLRVEPAHLIPFACLSDPAIHVLTYPNGDVTHAFAMCFLAREWTGRLRIAPDEVLRQRFLPIGEPPEPIHEPTRVVLEMFAAYEATGLFQAR